MKKNKGAISDKEMNRLRRKRKSVKGSPHR